MPSAGQITLIPVIIVLTLICVIWYNSIFMRDIEAASVLIHDFVLYKFMLSGVWAFSSFMITYLLIELILPFVQSEFF